MVSITITMDKCGGVAQLARAFGSYPEGRGFESLRRYHYLNTHGGLAQLGEHLPYKQRVGGSIPSASTIFTNAEPWCRGLTCLPVTQETAGSNPVGSAIFNNIKLGSVAQLVEQRTENPRVGGSIPSRATILENLICRCSSVGRATDL